MIPIPHLDDISRQARLLAWAQATVAPSPLDRVPFTVATVAAVIGPEGWELRLGAPDGRAATLRLAYYLNNPPPRSVSELVETLELHRARTIQ